jgi:class 3 adenylate cyclase
MDRKRETGGATRRPRQAAARLTGTRGGGQTDARSGTEREASTIACDIVGYTRGGRRIQVEQVRGINQVVAAAIARQPPGSVLWASEGDGGHVLFLGELWQAPAVALLRDLLAWAERAGVTLRIAAHRGPVDVIQGADDREQPVGDAINTAARVLDMGSEAGIVVSSQFRAAFGVSDGVEFHEERLVREKHGSPLELWLMSVGRRSQWSDALGVEHRMLRVAVDRGMGLEAIFHAKRLLQLNSDDPEVTSALAGLEPIHFRYWTASGKERLNPILGHLDPADLRHVIDHGELIERGYNDVICRHGDVGTTMFVILRGQVGVYSTSERARLDPALPRVTLAEGEIVGELAFALNRRRTADVISLGDTALLSFDYHHVSRLLSDRREMLGGVMREFMNGRALEHVSQNVPYLIGQQLTSLPDDRRRQWRGHLNVLQPGSHIIEQPPRRPFRLADIRHGDRRREPGGIYILASGRLSSRAGDEGPSAKRLDGEGFPLLYVDLPQHVVAPDSEYMVDEGPRRSSSSGWRRSTACRPTCTRGSCRRSNARWRARTTTTPSSRTTSPTGRPPSGGSASWVVPASPSSATRRPSPASTTRVGTARRCSTRSRCWSSSLPTR